MNRRDFLKTLPPLSATLALASCGNGGRAEIAGAASARTVMTVRGPIPTDALGITLTHEHLVADLRPFAEQLRAPVPADDDEVLDIVLPHLASLSRHGCRTLIESTAVGLGRSPALLRRIAEESGLNIVTVTGNYAAVDGQFLPPYVLTDSVDALAARWIAEYDEGIDGTGIRPGFIKLGFGGGPLNEAEGKLIRAAAITHLETGMTIGAHTTAATSAFEQLAILEAAGVNPSAWVWIHAHEEPDLSHQTRAARQGAWISFDGINQGTVDAHVAMVAQLRDEGLLHRVLVSQDAGWYTLGEPGGGDFRPFDLVFTEFVPALRAAGVTEDEIERIFVENPSRAYAIGVRRRGG